MRIYMVLLLGFLINPFSIWADSSGFQLSSMAFEDNGKIPTEYACDGQNINPPLSFSNIPDQTKSLALTISDPDAPSGLWSHWILYNIAPNTFDIHENTSPGTPGINSFGKFGYGGPCPPPGKVHHYIFNAYALDLVLPDGSQTLQGLERAVQGHIIAQAQLRGTYQR